MRCELSDIDASLAPALETPPAATDPAAVLATPSKAVAPPPAPETEFPVPDPVKLIATSSAVPPAPETPSAAIDALPVTSTRPVAPDVPPPAPETPSAAIEPAPIMATPSEIADPPRPGAPAATASGAKRGHVAIIAAVFLAGGAGLVISRPSIPSDSPALNASMNPIRPVEVRPASPPPAIPATSSSAPKWVPTPHAWATDGSRIVGVELPAENDVRVWMNHVRPVLAVRCLARRVEAFVITEAAASIESVPDQHTVQVSFDGQEASGQRWADSESKRELFAPDGAALADRLSRAHTMRFGFTPYGAQPVVAEFDVRGFERPSCEPSRANGAARVAYRGAR